MKTGIIKSIQAFGGTETKGGNGRTFYQFELEIYSGGIKDVGFLWRTRPEPWVSVGDVVDYNLGTDKNGKPKFDKVDKKGNLSRDWEKQHQIIWQSSMQRAMEHLTHHKTEFTHDEVIDVAEIFSSAIISFGKERL